MRTAARGAEDAAAEVGHVMGRAMAFPAPLPDVFAWVVAFPRAALGLGIAAGALSFASVYAVGGARSAPVLAAAAVYALYWVWLPLALRSLVRGTARDVVDLAPTLEGSRLGAEELAGEVFAAAARAIPAGVAVGLAVALLDLVIIFHAVGGAELEGAPAIVYVVVRELLTCWLIFTVLGWAVGAALALSRSVRDHARVELLDPHEFAPLGRCGARLALWWLLMVGITLVFLFSPAASHRMVVDVLLVTLGFGAAAAVALLIPTWGAHRALARAKAEELARARAQLRAARESGDEARVPGLVAWEQRIASVSEWPIDAGSAGLTGLYVMIPLASWVAGALVERVVNALLG